jgi:hypothetical protein
MLSVATVLVLVVALGVAHVARTGTQAASELMQVLAWGTDCGVIGGLPRSVSSIVERLSHILWL